MTVDESLTPEQPQSPNEENQQTPFPELSALENQETVDDVAPPAEPIPTVDAEAQPSPPELSEINSLLEAKQKLTTEVQELQQTKMQLETEIEVFQAEQQQLLAQETLDVKTALQEMVSKSLEELQQKHQSLQVSVEKLERRRERIQEEMKTTFAGVSQDLAIRVQGFKDYLLGSLQDLVVAAEQLELPNNEPWESSEPKPQASKKPQTPTSIQPQFAEQSFQDQVQKVRAILDQYRTRPDYYGPPWQLRRTFEPIHAERVRKWFFSQGGRGALKSMGSRLQNILVASAIMSVLHQLYGNRFRALVLANTPERLGEWRRGLQDCLGISRSDFGPERGVVLFEQPIALIQKAERLVEEKRLPLVIIDETEDNIDLGLLQFPLWLAFAPEPQSTSNYFY